jgi:predicted metal-binding membrane protein
VDPAQIGLFEALPVAVAIPLTCWQDGSAGAFIMGLRHGAYCLGCCWLLMAVLFAVGVMSLAWIAALSAFVLLEKIISRGLWVSKVAGLFLIGWSRSLDLKPISDCLLCSISFRPLPSLPLAQLLAQY